MEPFDPDVDVPGTIAPVNVAHPTKPDRMDVPWRTTATIDEFLEELAFSDSKLEFFEGRIVAFAGGSVAHSRLCARLIGYFLAASRPGCTVLTSDAAVRVGTSAYVFPDVTYTCEELAPSATEIVAPSVVVEVISPQSTRRDRVEKLRAYLQIPSLNAYVLVDSLRPSVTIFARENGRLVATDYLEPEATVRLETPDVRFTISELYAGILA